MAEQPEKRNDSEEPEGLSDRQWLGCLGCIYLPQMIGMLLVLVFVLWLYKNGFVFVLTIDCCYGNTKPLLWFLT